MAQCPQAHRRCDADVAEDPVFLSPVVTVLGKLTIARPADAAKSDRLWLSV